MATITSEYLGDLKISITHVDSGTTIITDPPVDNGGQGRSFSPTDLCATALATCTMGLVAQYAESKGLSVKGTKMDIVKKMAQNPRKIARIETTFTMPAGTNFSDEDKRIIEESAHSCPMHNSLHPDVEKVAKFIWQ